MVNGVWRMYETPIGLVKVYLDNCVYEPSDDTMLALKTAFQLVRRLKFKPVIILDAGSGSGLIGAALSLNYDSFVVAVDINPHAVRSTMKTLDGRGVSIQCRWASCLTGSFDLSILNPPYLPVNDRLEDCPYLPQAWSSNPQLLEEACNSVARISKAIVIVYSSLSGWEPYWCLERHGFRIIVSRVENFFMEKLWAIGAWRI